LLNVEGLASLPKRGRLVPEAERDDIRELLFSNYRIMYRVDKERIVILTILHGTRDLTKVNTKPWEME
jgi:toxin ParE1/3/4